MSSNQQSFTEQGMPTHQQLVIPVLQSLSELGGSAKSRESLDHMVDNYPHAEQTHADGLSKQPRPKCFSTSSSFWTFFSKTYWRTRTTLAGNVFINFIRQRTLSLA